MAKKKWVSSGQPMASSLGAAGQGSLGLTCFVPVSISHYSNGRWLQGCQELHNVFLGGKEMCFPFCLHFLSVKDFTEQLIISNWTVTIL